MDNMDVTTILNYGVDTQKKVADISHLLLISANRAEMDEVSQAMHQTMKRLRELEQSNLFTGKITFGRKADDLRVQNELEEMLGHVDQLEDTLEHYRVNLLMESEMFHYLNRMSHELTTELGEKIDGAEELATLLKEKKQGAAQKDGMVTNEITHMKHRVEELKVTKEIASQQVVQTEVLRNAVAGLLSELQTILYQVIPLWKNSVSEGLYAKEKLKEVKERLHENNQMLLGSLDTIENVRNQARGAMNATLQTKGTSRSKKN